MGITCKPIGKFESIMRKLDNKQLEEKMEMKKKATKSEKS
jgi:hypothetical protein